MSPGTRRSPPPRTRSLRPGAPSTPPRPGLRPPPPPGTRSATRSVCVIAAPGALPTLPRPSMPGGPPLTSAGQVLRGRASHLNGLATGLRERAAAGPPSAAADDLREAIALHRRAIELMAESTELAGFLTNLGMSLHGLAAATGDTEAYVEAVEVFRRAVTAGQETAPGQALDAALGWRRLATDGVPVWADVAAASDAALDALRRLLRSQVLRADKEAWLRSTRDVTAWAGRAHLELGHPAAGALALERGRALMLSDALPPLETRAHPARAARAVPPGDVRRRTTGSAARPPAWYVCGGGQRDRVGGDRRQRSCGRVPGRRDGIPGDRGRTAPRPLGRPPRRGTRPLEVRADHTRMAARAAARPLR